MPRTGGRALSPGGPGGWRRWPRWRRWLVGGGGSILLLLVLLGVAGCSLLGGQFAPVVATPEMARQGLESRYAELGDLKIHYVVAASPADADARAPVVLFVHGSPGTWEAWRGYLENPELRAAARLVALDRPGFGATARGAAEPSLARQAAACRAVLDAEGARRAVIVGHSLGGPIAAQLAVDDPGRVAGLLLVAPSIDPALERHRWFNVAGSLRPVQWFLPVDFITSNREIWPLRSQLEALAPRLAGIEVPVIVVQGSDDSLVSPANAEFAARAFPADSISVRRLPGATHFVVWEDPAAVRRPLLELLGRD